jgi:hypothetical protein
MEDPVTARDGYTYDRKAITQWLQTKSTSPMVGGGAPLAPHCMLHRPAVPWPCCCPASSLQPPASSLQPPASSLQPPA